MLLTEPRDMIIITSAINALAYFEILDDFHSTSIEICFCDDKFIFDDYKTSFNRSKGIKVFLKDMLIKSILWPMTPDVNLIKYL